MSEENRKAIRISVRNLVEFVLRSGDIDNRCSGNAQKDAMLAGGRIHRKIQKRMGAGYRAEVPLKHEVQDEEQEITLLVEGRADGIFAENGIPVIDEIKGMYTDISRLEEPIEVHLAQAMCYGYFYCCDKDLDGIRLQMTYCNLETEEIKRFQTDRSREELETWFSGVVHEYFKWARYLYHHELIRDASIGHLEFPFPYRAGQRDLVVSVYRTVSRKKRLFIQAPTGIGKTLSTVFPAVRAIGEGKGDKLFYLTAKTVTRTVAEEAFRILRDHGLIFTSVTITAKEKLCPMDECECNPDACPYAKGHFDRVNEAVFDILHLEQEMTREKILQYAEKYRVCPFEYCLDISSWTDGIICDYNYVFDPNVRLKRYFADGQKGDYLFLVDEAHNLVSRAREMYSAELKKEDLLTVKRLVKQKAPRLEKNLEKCSQVMLGMKRECETWQLLSDVTSLAAAAMAESRTNFTLERRKKQPALLLCANCGHSLLKETEHLLKCSDARTNGDPVCRSLVLQRELLEENILGLVHQYAASMLEKEKKISSKRQCEYKEINTAELQKQSRQLTSEKMKLYDDYKDGRIDRDSYKQRAGKISVQLDEIKRKIEDAENSKKLLEQNELSDKIKLKDFLGIQKFDTEKLREIIKVIRVHSQDEIEIEWNFDDIFSEQR